jgi:hypothetical protein
MKTQFDPKTASARVIEQEGFRHGANDVPAQDALNEIDSTFARRKAEIREAASPRIKLAEAEAASLRKLSQEAQSRWNALKANAGDEVPRIGMPLLKVILGMFALGAEAILLAPTLDMVGIADPDHQLWAAAAIVTIAAVIFHHYLETRHALPPDRLAQILGASAISGLLVLGLMRAKQLAFAANLSGNPMGRFLHDVPWLGGILFVFLTVFFPVSAAIALHHGFDNIHAWLQFRKAQKRATRLSRNADQAQKKLESESEQLEHQLDQLDQRTQEWKSAYQTYHHLGCEVGAKQRPLWIVWVKATVLAIVAFVFCVVAGTLLSGPLASLGLVLSLLIACATWMVAATYFHRRWEHPSPAQYLEQANLRFRNGTGSPIPTRPLPVQRSISGAKVLPIANADENASVREVN